MRILYITNARIPTEKAHGLQIIKTIEALSAAGCQVELLLPRRRNYLKKNIFDFYNLKTEFKITYIKNYFGWLESYFHKLYFSLQRFSFGLAAFACARRSSADVIYSREITICFFLSLVGKKVVFEDHEPKKRLRWLYKIFIKKIKKKVVVAHNLVELYQHFNIDKQSYTEAPNGVDLIEFEDIKKDKSIWQKEFKILEKEKVVLYVGHFYTWKGVYVLLDAAKNIKAKVVLIGGIPQDQEKVKQYIKDNRIINVVVHEFVPHQEIIKYLKSADVLILPNTAQEERSANYTTPIKLFEYLASDVPVVASNVRSFAAYLKNNENCLLCEPDNSKDLTEKINEVLSNQTLVDRISQQARKEVSQYSWLKRAEKIIEFIKQ